MAEKNMLQDVHGKQTVKCIWFPDLCWNLSVESSTRIMNGKEEDSR